MNRLQQYISILTMLLTINTTHIFAASRSVMMRAWSARTASMKAMDTRVMCAYEKAHQRVCCVYYDNTDLSKKIFCTIATVGRLKMHLVRTFGVKIENLKIAVYSDLEKSFIDINDFPQMFLLECIAGSVGLRIRVIVVDVSKKQLFLPQQTPASTTVNVEFENNTYCFSETTIDDLYRAVAKEFRVCVDTVRLYCVGLELRKACNRRRDALLKNILPDMATVRVCMVPIIKK